jgi:putative membrane protein
MRSERNRLGLGLVALVLAVLVWSGIRPHDRFTWFMEVFPVLLGVPLLLAIHRRFPLTPLLTVLLALHACILMLGGKYTYAEVPIGNWVRDAFGLSRNHSPVGRYAQGFVRDPRARDPLAPLAARGSRWLPFVAVAAAFACYGSSNGGRRSPPASATAFRATQGDVWNTQWDMFCRRRHDGDAHPLSGLHERVRDLTGLNDGGIKIDAPLRCQWPVSSSRPRSRCRSSPRRHQRLPSTSLSQTRPVAPVDRRAHLEADPCPTGR